MVERRNVQLIIILKQQDDGREEKCSVNNHLETMVERRNFQLIIILKQQDDGRAKKKCLVNNNHLKTGYYNNFIFLD